MQSTALRLALYARVSSDRQEREQTIQSQIGALTAYAARLDGEIVQDGDSPIFADDGISGATLSRPALSRLRGLLATDAVDAVLVYDTDRLSRDQVDLHQLALREIVERGVELHIVKSGQRFEDTDEGHALFGLNAIFNRLERRKIAERARRGMKRRAQVEGRRTGGIPSFGFDVEDGHYVLNAEEVGHCRQMRAWLVDELTPGIIAQKLMALGVPTKYDSLGIVRSGSTRKRATWYPDQVRRVLTDRLYGGEMVYRAWDGEEIVTTIRAIFTLDELTEHRRIIDRNRSVKKRSDGEINVLRGLVVCGECGRRYIAGRASALGKYDRWYRCGVWHRPKNLRNCSNRAWKAAVLEGSVWRIVSELVAEPERALEALESGTTDRPELRIEQLTKRRSELDAEDDRVRSGLRAGIFTVEQAADEIRRSQDARRLIDSELAEIVDRFEQQERSRDAAVVLAALRDRIAEATPEQKAAVLREIVERVTVRGDSIEIQVIVGARPNGGTGEPIPGHAGVVLGSLRASPAELVRRDRERRQ